jgi:hypothetical protein
MYFMLLNALVRTLHNQVDIGSEYFHMAALFLKRANDNVFASELRRLLLADVVGAVAANACRLFRPRFMAICLWNMLRPEHNLRSHISPI